MCATGLLPAIEVRESEAQRATGTVLRVRDAVGGGMAPQCVGVHPKVPRGFARRQPTTLIFVA
jgi:hypothetical protein